MPEYSGTRDIYLTSSDVFDGRGNLQYVVLSTRALRIAGD